MKESNKKMRVFIGIKISKDITALIKKIQKKIISDDTVLTHEEDMHLTIIPPLEIDVENKHNFFKKINNITKEYNKFVLKLDHLEYKPNKTSPRLIWIKCFNSEELESLKGNLSKELGISNNNNFLPHITVARFKKNTKKPIKIEDNNTLLNNTFMNVENIEVFESGIGKPLSTGKPKYKVIKSFPIKK